MLIFTGKHSGGFLLTRSFSNKIIFVVCGIRAAFYKSSASAMMWKCVVAYKDFHCQVPQGCRWS